MRKTLLAVLFLLLATGAAFAQYLVNFEGATETKTGYASGTVNLSGLDWNMTEALIGNSTSDWKLDTKSARMRGYGISSMSMLADKTTGIGTVSFQYRRYGTDAQVDWKVEYSVNGGTDWIQTGTSFTAPATDDVQTFSSTVNVSGNARIRIKRATETGTANARLNIDNITLTDYSGGAPTPVISVTGTLSAFSTITGTPSASQSYTLSGANLTANIAVVAPAGYALSTDQSTWTSSLSLASTYNGLVYVRLTGASAGSYNGNITHNSTGASEQTLAVSGTVNDPIPTINVTGSTTAFSAITGSPSAAQTYNVAGSFLTDNITITPPAGFEISLSSGSGYASSLILTHTGGTVASTPIYVRLNGTTAGSFSGDITHVAGTASSNLAVSGTVTDPAAPTTFLEENFVYTIGTTASSNGWTAHSGGGTASPLIDANNLVYAGYFANAGGSVRTTGVTGEDISRAITQQTSGDIYCSFLMNITSLPNTTQDYNFHLGDAAVLTGGTNFRGRLYVQKDASGAIRFGISKGSTSTAVIQFTPYSYTINTTYLMVLKYKIVAGAANDEVYLWVNPAIGETEPTHTLFIGTGDTTSDAANIGSVAIRQSANTPAAYYDGIRITNNWPLLWSGEEPEPPVLHVSTPELDPLACIVGTPSEEIGSYTLYGDNLQGAINLDAPDGFELSTDGLTGWSNTLNVGSSFNGLIYVRLNAGISGDYEGNIVHTSTNADPVNVYVTGTAFEPETLWNITQNLVPFSSEAGTVSAAQSYTLSATNATQNLELSVGAPFEISTSETGTYSATLSLAPTFNGSIWVRMNSATAGAFDGIILHATANATNYELNVSGEATPPAGNYASDLFFSEYIEGSSNNKAIEIFNGTGISVNLANYTVKLGANGNAWGNTLTLSGTLAHGDVYVIANASANATILAQSDITSTVTFFNGNDALGLFNGETLIDAIGTYLNNPGTSWPAAGVTTATLDHTLIRKPTVTAPNADWTVSAGTNADDSEWIVQNIDYVADLGMHTFNPGAPIVSTPVISPNGGVFTSPVSVSITCSTADAQIRYTVNGDEPTETSTLYSSSFNVTANTTVKARAFKVGYTQSAVATAVFSFPVDVATISVLRAQATGTTVYRLTGEAVLTFQQATRNQKFIQDATAAIVIDDPLAAITTVYNLGDGITGITGTLGVYSGLLQFTPIADPGAATSTGNVVTPEVRTAASLTSADQAKLVKIVNATLDTTLGNFPAAAANINLTDASGTIIMRTFAGRDYADTPIPAVATDVVGLVGEFGGAMQISPRWLADMTPSASLSAPNVTVSIIGTNVTISWDAVAGAMNYRIEGSNDPFGTFTPITNTPDLNWTGPVESMQFFKVIAIQ